MSGEFSEAQANVATIEREIDPTLYKIAARCGLARQAFNAVGTITTETLAARAEYGRFVSEELRGQRIRFSGAYEVYETKQSPDARDERQRRYVAVTDQEAVVTSTVIADTDDPELHLSLIGAEHTEGWISLFKAKEFVVLPAADSAEAA